MSFTPPAFGTDGLRGPAGEPPMDPDTLRRVGAALGLWLQRSGPAEKRVLVGNDGRESSLWIAEALAHGLAGTEIATSDLGLCSTPALAWVTRAHPFSAGIMISASHNPARDNGIKIFDGDGRKLSDEAESAISELCAHVEPDPEVKPRLRERTELLDGYVNFLANSFLDLDLTGVTIVLDAANGGASEIAPTLLTGLGADVVGIGCEPDGFNINDGVGALHPESIAETVQASGAVLGICLDGDADRCILVDDTGRVRNGDDILATLAVQRLGDDRLPAKTAVSTVMANWGLKKFLEAEGIDLVMTPVGDRHIAKAMREHGYELGAEQSGHVLLRVDGELCGDGLFTALEVLALPGLLKQGASRTLQDFPRFPQVLINVAVRSKPALEEIAGLGEAQAAVEKELGDDGRVLLRYSGTESLLRVMVEGPEKGPVEAHAERLAQVVRDQLGA